jgi:hypothetical protein
MVTSLEAEAKQMSEDRTQHEEKLDNPQTHPGNQEQGATPMLPNSAHVPVFGGLVQLSPFPWMSHCMAEVQQCHEANLLSVPIWTKVS